MKFAHVSHREEELMQKLCKQGNSMNEIQLLTDKSKDTIAKHTDHARPRSEKSGQDSGRLKSLRVSVQIVCFCVRCWDPLIDVPVRRRKSHEFPC